MLLNKIIATFPLLIHYSALAHPLKPSKHLVKRGEFHDFNAFSPHLITVQLGGVDDPKLELENHDRLKVTDFDSMGDFEKVEAYLQGLHINKHQQNPIITFPSDSEEVTKDGSRTTNTAFYASKNDPMDIFISELTPNELRHHHSKTEIGLKQHPDNMNVEYPPEDWIASGSIENVVSKNLGVQTPIATVIPGSY
ncbi:hypothetical protein PGT21_007646 [Puccinia graminis f. sp. tritici]|uniref:Peptidase S53 activation domain-containing protein n=1 Tax=Puccinia graminis f. sp. tritici TaxID=56615 RepID=A0A5B0MKW4_PUCGR|nr:hypothetical protein PGT21_007646 [Puccinia graminis f. sp. tritici]KAA1135514.1 hypothetical protein PGTUg99_009956 [Puccinia graminis f. sp. tritici]